MATIRSLSIADLVALQSLFGANSPDPQQLGRELQRNDVYLWMGLFGGGQLVAAHRAMVLGGRLLLKGVSVATTNRGSTAAWRLALAMKAAAAARGCSGVAAWIEPHRPERFIAARLGVKAAGPLVHRFLIPLPGADEDAAVDTLAPLTGTLEMRPCDAALVPDLLDGVAGQVNWVIDGSRIVLSGNPCRNTEGLPSLLSMLRPLASRAGARAAEIHLPASDLAAAFSIVAPGVARLSRTPVRMGLLALPPIDGTAPTVSEACA